MTSRHNLSWLGGSLGDHESRVGSDLVDTAQFFSMSSEILLKWTVGRRNSEIDWCVNDGDLWLLFVDS